MIYSNKYKTTYLERPVTDDEKALALLLETLTIAVRDNNLEKLKSVFSPHASIVLSSTENNAPVNVMECITHLAKFVGNIAGINYEEVLIRVSGSRALVSAIRSVYLKGEMPHRTPRYIKCEKKDNKWRIIEANFI